MSNRHDSYAVASLLFALVGAILVVPVAAQYLEPDAPPPEGRSGVYLDISSQPQQKLGSLLIGDGDVGDQLCLNSPSTGDAGPYCLGSWSDVYERVNGPFVKVRQDQIGAAPEVVSSYDSLRQNGYMRLRGAGSTPATTYQSDADAGAGTKVGIYAGDRGDISGYAAQFTGQLRINEHNNVGADPGELCLGPFDDGGTAPYDQAGPAPRYGCLQQWSQLTAGLIGPYLKVQSSNPPSDVQLGSVRMAGKAFQLDVGTVVGGVTPGMICAGGNCFCGDGLCSAEAGETAATCSNDC
ncbi:MAG: hypothetical protein HYY50_01505 [Candidatus Kerfeldbacteria bacterium]|nr:hypothetical protein [Candidatus Kerfeldbacteria bacterium]